MNGVEGVTIQSWSLGKLEYKRCLLEDGSDGYPMLCVTDGEGALRRALSQLPLRRPRAFPAIIALLQHPGRHVHAGRSDPCRC